MGRATVTPSGASRRARAAASAGAIAAATAASGASGAPSYEPANGSPGFGIAWGGKILASTTAG